MPRKAKLSRQKVIEEVDEESYRIETLVERERDNDGNYNYRVRFHGYGKNDDLWYTEAQLLEADQKNRRLIKAFDKQLETKK